MQFNNCDLFFSLVANGVVFVLELGLILNKNTTMVATQTKMQRILNYWLENIYQVLKMLKPSDLLSGMYFIFNCWNCTIVPNCIWIFAHVWFDEIFSEFVSYQCSKHKRKWYFVTKNCSDLLCKKMFYWLRKLLKFEAKGQEFAKFLRSL